MDKMGGCGSGMYWTLDRFKIENEFEAMQYCPYSFQI
jgi:hypothetical protein